MNRKQWKEFAAAVLMGAALAGVIILLAGCNTDIDFRKKALAAEIKVYGLDAEIPSTTSDESLARIRIGVVTTRYISAPDGGRASIETEYSDLNFWTLSGSAKSKLCVENNPAFTSTATDSKAE